MGKKVVYTKENPYNWYFKTPDFLVQDISDILKEDRNINVIPYSKVKEILTKNGAKQQYMATMRNFNNSYNVDFNYLKKVALLSEYFITFSYKIAKKVQKTQKIANFFEKTS